MVYYYIGAMILLGSACILPYAVVVWFRQRLSLDQIPQPETSFDQLELSYVEDKFTQSEPVIISTRGDNSTASLQSQN